MKKTIFLLAVAILLSGCATYKFQKGAKPPYDKGYVATYWGEVLPEYTIGKNNTVPDNLSLAQERFNRRRLTVEKYYKDMGYIESRYKEVFWDPPVTIVHIILGIFKLPFIAYSDYKYEHDTAYREKINKAEEDEYQKEKARISLLRSGLNKYIQQDLSMESAEQPSQAVSSQAVPAAEAPKNEATQAEAPKIENAPSEIKQQPAEAQPAAEQKMESAPVTPEEKVQPQPAANEPPVPEEKAPAASQEVKEEAKTPVSAPEQTTQAPAVQEENKNEVPVVKQAAPVAVIIAHPAKGFSPLKVNFYGTKSHSPNGRIVSYEWDFGDGDTSNKPKPVNTFWSTTYGTRVFTVILTVKDSKGMTATTTQPIEVTNK